MEATATLAASTSSSPACSNHIYWKRCFICQNIKRPAKKFPLSQASAEDIDHFRVTSHMTNCVFGRHVGGKTKKNKKSF